MSILESVLALSKAVLIGAILVPQQSSVGGKKECAESQTVTDSTYRAGQVWSYKTRPNEKSSTLTILRVETTPKVGVIIHVHVDKVQFSNCTGGPAPTSIDHAPFTKAAIDKSVIRQIRETSELPAFEAGYRDWLAHCGGVYTISVAEMIGVNDTTFNAGLGCKM
jgi:hypothetical protein